MNLLKVKKMNEQFIFQQWSNIILPKDDKIKLYKIDEILDKGLKVHVISMTISAVLIFTTFILLFPHGIKEWTFKVFEIIAILISVYAMIFVIMKNRTEKELQKSKTILVIDSKKERVSLEKHIDKQTMILINSIKSWAKFHKLKFKHTKHNHLRHIIDFINFPVDYIDIKIINYKLNFEVRVNDLNIVNKIGEELPRNCKNLALVIDKYHVGLQDNLEIDEGGIKSAKELIVNVILTKVYNTIKF